MAAKKKTPPKKTAPSRPVVRKVIRKAVPKKLTPIMRSVQPPGPETPVVVTLVIPPPAPLMIPHVEIARRAYEIWEWKVRIANDALRNWAEAEAAIRADLGEV